MLLIYSSPSSPLVTISLFSMCVNLFLFVYTLYLDLKIVHILLPLLSLSLSLCLLLRNNRNAHITPLPLLGYFCMLLLGIRVCINNK